MKHIKLSQQFDISILYIAVDDAVFIMLLPEAKLKNDIEKHNNSYQKLILNDII